jgi:hypothetical protein
MTVGCNLTHHQAVGERPQFLRIAGGATPVEPKAISPTEARYTATTDKPAVYAYSDNHLIGLKHAVIMEVEATTAIRQAKSGRPRQCSRWASSMRSPN